MARSAIENYFMQGKSASMNIAKARRGKRAENPDDNDDEDGDERVNKMIAEFTKCDLPGLRDYINNKDSSAFDKQLENLADTEFQKWKLYLASGFNILLHGVGSKREVLTKF